MLFTSIEFAIFLPLVFALYWLTAKHRKTQLVIILVSSYFFYAWWDWRFLGLIIFSSLIDFLIGLQMGKTTSKLKKKRLLGLSLFTNLGLLGVFKYFNFFLQSFSEAFSLFGQNMAVARLDIVLPVGISFYTFQTLSYTIDIYRGKLSPTKDVLAFFSFVSFFPQLVAGPIERASHLLGQFTSPRRFDYAFAVSGVRIFIWGFFKKVVIADNAASLVDLIFANYSDQSSAALMFGAILFAFQIYGDFSGYSDMAIGLSRILGFDLMLNFRFPYLAQNINDFWKRWHISLSSWFRDYLYIPIGGSHGSSLFALRNVMIVFVVSGFWHGANWTFIVWGILHGLLYIPMFLNKSKQNLTVHKPLRRLPNIFLTFSLVCIAWIFFRAESLTDALGYIYGLFTNSGSANMVLASNQRLLVLVIVMISSFAMLFLEFKAEIKQKSEVLLPSYGLGLLVLAIVFFGAFNNPEDFIYFQF
ncbi:MBOAT family O-acyltransferase [Algoriphagus namhaensis]|uniref:MBOAT family O-acyltransferase n=1 Tax=Algoriphagus namhaensis TaxID=915353 RepID=A0ABV8APN4_9BACT